MQRSSLPTLAALAVVFAVGCPRVGRADDALGLDLEGVSLRDTAKGSGQSRAQAGLVVTSQRFESLQPSSSASSAARPADLTLPTWIAVGAGSADWASSVASCPGSVCRTITPLLPGVGRLEIAYPLGLALDALVVWSAHTWIARRWPRLAESLVYGLGLAHTITASRHIATTRARVAATSVSP